MNNESSLDRFLRNRAAIGLGVVDQRILKIQRMLSGMFVGIGVGCAAVATAGGHPELTSAVFPLIMAGSAMFASSQVLRRRFHATNTAEWKLTIEAKGLLLRLVRKRNGWLDGGSWQMFGPMVGYSPMLGRRARRRMRHLSWETEDLGFGFFGKSPEVGPEVIALLDVAAEQYNRIQGILQAPAPTGTLSKLTASAVAAADEAMGDILHDCATLDRFPESASATRKQIETSILSLRELADRLEDVATRDQLLTDKVDYASRIDSVLEELRLEQLARSELQGNDGDQQRRQQT